MAALRDTLKVVGSLFDRIDSPLEYVLLGMPGLWLAPMYLFADSLPLMILMALACLWLMWRMTTLAYYDMYRRFGFFGAMSGTAAIAYCPVFWFVWYYFCPHADHERHLRERAMRHDVLPAWEEGAHGRWMARRGWERAANTLHVERDLLAGKSRAAIQAHLEREMLELPSIESLLREPVSPASEHPLAKSLSAGEELPPWETLGAVGTFDEIEDRMWTPPTPPKYEAPHIPGVSDYALDRLYGEGKFDVIVALLRTRLMILRDRAGSSEGLEDYLRLARSQQLHRELEKYRREYDQLALTNASPTAPAMPTTSPDLPVTAPAQPRADAPD